MRNKFQLAIDALPVHFTRLREGGIYWLTVDDEAVADLLLVSFIQGLLPDSRYFLTSSLPMTETLQSALHHPQVRGELFALTQDPQGEWLRRLPAEMEWFGISKAADLLVVRYRCDGLEKDPDAQAAQLLRLDRALQQFTHWAEQQELAVLVIGSGAHSSQQRQWLNRGNNWLSGCVHLSRQGELVDYDLAYWRNEMGVTSGMRLMLLQRDTQLVLHTERGSLSSASLADDDVVLAMQEVLANTIAPSAHWKLFPDRPRLMEAALQAVKATVIFAITESSQTEALARDIYQLRSERGARLKIVVREAANCLRNLDDRLFLSAGANMVMPFACHVSRFIGLLQMVQGQVYPHMIRPEIDSLLAASQPQRLKGYLPATEFIRLLQDEMRRSLTSETRGLMLILTPAMSLSMTDALAQCEMRRQGDVLTVADNHIYVFFFACRPNDAERALQNAFYLPVNTLFTESQVLSVREEIQEALARLQQLPEQPDFTAELTARAGVRDPQLQSSKVEMTALERNHAAVKPITLPIKAI